MRLIFWLVAVPVLVVTAFFVITNRAEVTVGLWPLTVDIRLPLWALILASLYLGFMIGAIAAWAAGHRHRARAREAQAEAHRLESELERLRADRVRESATPAPAPRPAALPAAAGGR